MEGDYATDAEDETSVSIVRQIRIAEFINSVVAKRRFDHLRIFVTPLAQFAMCNARGHFLRF